MMTPEYALLIVIDIVIVVVAIGACFASAKLMAVIHACKRTGWWSILTGVLAYAAIIRLIILLNDAAILPSSIRDAITVWSPAAMLVFWVGIFAFIYGMYKVTSELIGTHDCD